MSALQHVIFRSRSAFTEQLFLILTLILLNGLLEFTAHATETHAFRPPNILIILADDMGFSDAGCYGGEIKTPNLDRLASQGLRFTQFYNTSRCWPTRAALLSGYYPQQIRMDPPQGRVPPWTTFLPQWLKPLNYRSYHSGKWHVHGAPQPIRDAGFDRSYRLEDHDRHFYPTNHWLNDVALPPVPKGSNYFTSRAITDFLLETLQAHNRENPTQPFFAYLAFTVPHFPIQAPQELIANYKRIYAVGWDAIRRQRQRALRRLGITTAGVPHREKSVTPRWNLSEKELIAEVDNREVAHDIAWNELTDAQREYQVIKMSIYGAMISHMDAQIGRVLDQLKTMGAEDNTIVIFASDNGASAELINRGDRHQRGAVLGSGESYLCLGPGWSAAANTPFRLHKSYSYEGGISTPFIVRWPNTIAARGALSHQPGHIIDIVPTLLHACHADPFNLAERGAPPFPGMDLSEAFANPKVQSARTLYFHHDQNRGLRIGDWKIVSMRPDTNRYSLYDLKNDRNEQIDLARDYPTIVETMAGRWDLLTTAFQEGLK